MIVYFLKDSPNIREIEQETENSFSGRKFTIISRNGSRVFGTARMDIGCWGIESIPFWVLESDLEKFEDGSVRF